MADGHLALKYSSSGITERLAVYVELVGLLHLVGVECGSSIDRSSGQISLKPPTGNRSLERAYQLATSGVQAVTESVMGIRSHVRPAALLSLQRRQISRRGS